MEVFNNEKYQKLENVEELFKKVNCFGNEYNYCFGAAIPQSVLSTTLLSTGGAIGGLIAHNIQKNKLHSFIVNKYEKGICLIPLYSDDKSNTLMDLDGYIDINNEEIASITIKFADISWKKVTITLKDERKIIMNVIKNNKAFKWHKNNFQRFIELYK